MVFLFPVYDRDHRSVWLVEFFLRQYSKTHPHYSLPYIFLLLFYMKFHYLATPFKIDSMLFFKRYIKLLLYKKG
ncbi:hypothetical protein COD19_07810 [Bacillus cereus]|uniref:Uncharacterized protein n=1 Tax=Bacillus cereus TaxID=1396 RepID=A0A2C1M416_BACCE|nr:hypothetical protein COD19_07810 [Bacillus cereus]PGX10732.1 hypothetical protein COE07_13180 [Bacillus sp. AFS033286]